MAEEKQYKLGLTEKQVVALGLVFDQTLKNTGVQFIDIIYELRSQIAKQITPTDPENTNQPE
jgi:hypothetical protein